MSYVRPPRRSRGPGTPNPIAPTSSVSSSVTAASSSTTSSSCERVGVIRSWRRSTSPSRVTTPARIFVPPRSTPIACVAVIPSGYRNPLDGRLRREALPRLPRRTPEGEGAAARPRAQARARTDAAATRRTAPSAAGVVAQADRVVDDRRPDRPVDRVGGRRLLLRQQRRQRREQTLADRRHE